MSLCDVSPRHKRITLPPSGGVHIFTSASVLAFTFSVVPSIPSTPLYSLFREFLLTSFMICLLSIILKLCLPTNKGLLYFSHCLP